MATSPKLLVLRMREGADRVPVPGYPIVPLVFVLGTFWAACFIVMREPIQALAGLGTALLGIPVYFWMKRSTGGPTVKGNAE